MMSPDEARDRFSEALDDLLPREERAQFERALDRDPDLAEEYRAFRATVDLTRAFGRTPVPPPSVDLLVGVQERIRKRTRGRYYRDHRKPKSPTRWVMPVALAVLMVLLFAVAWAGLQSISSWLEGEGDSRQIEAGPGDDLSEPPGSGPGAPPLEGDAR